MSESLKLFTFRPIEYAPIAPCHPWLNPRENPKEPNVENTVKMNNEPVDSYRTRKSKKYAHVKSRITPEETSQYLDRKKIRERQRIEQVVKRETEEMQECTFRPVISRSFKHPY